MTKRDQNQDHPQDFEILDEKQPLGDLKQANDFFERLRQKITDWAETKAGDKGRLAAEVLLFAPDLFMLLVRLMRDPRIPSGQKVIIAAGITYFVTPIDFLPEALLGPFGYLDDAILAVYIINLVLNGNRLVVLENWSGNADLLHTLQLVAEKGEDLVGKRVHRQIQKFFQKKA